MPGSPFAVVHGIKRRPTETSAVTWCGSRLRLPAKPQSKRTGEPVTCARCNEQIKQALIRLSKTRSAYIRVRLQSYEYPAT